MAATGQTRQFGMLLFPGVQQLDLTGPYEVFASLDGARMHLVAHAMAPVVSATGLVLAPTVTFDTCPPLDVLCVPGGAGINALLQDRASLDFVRRQAACVRYLGAVCTGALLLGAAGLLQGRRATTHWASHDLLTAFGASPVHARVVQDGTLFTGGGVTAGIDFALTLVAAMAGRDAAEAIQLQLEYAPAPPFDAGSPDTARADILCAVKAASARIQQERRAIIAAIAGCP